MINASYAVLFDTRITRNNRGLFFPRRIMVRIRGSVRVSALRFYHEMCVFSGLIIASLLLYARCNYVCCVMCTRTVIDCADFCALTVICTQCN